MARYSPRTTPRPQPDDERELLVDDLTPEEQQEWEQFMAEPRISHYPDTSLGHLWDTAVAERGPPGEQDSNL